MAGQTEPLEVMPPQTTLCRRPPLASIEALDALKRNLACGLPAIEVRAASALLDQSLRATELAGLEARLDALEDTVTAACTHE